MGYFICVTMQARLVMLTGLFVVASVEADNPETQCHPVSSNGRTLFCFKLSNQNQEILHRIGRSVDMDLANNPDVNCSEPMPVGTLVTSICKPGYSGDPVVSACWDHGHPVGVKWMIDFTPCNAVCGVSKKEHHELRPLIVDGRPAHVGFFPWHAGLYYRNVAGGKVIWTQICGGTLITNRVVLTAAHCVSGKSESEVRVALGKYYRSWDHQEPTEVKRDISEFAIHHLHHERSGYQFDIALVLLSQEITFGENIMPACRDYDERIAQREKAATQLNVVGWGRTTPAMGGPSSETLLHNTVTAKSEQECRNFSPMLISSFDKFCASNNNAVSTAQPGDSGGGVTAVFEDGLHYVVGIVSAKSKSSGREMGYYTNVTWKYHYDWIEDQLKKWG